RNLWNIGEFIFSTCERNVSSCCSFLIFKAIEISIFVFRSVTPIFIPFNNLLSNHLKCSHFYYLEQELKNLI
ncbi:MAG: hypothetical protein QXF03_06190, partial [Thermoplasmata archaeon]